MFCRQFQLGEVFAGWRALNTVSSLMSGCGEVINPKTIDGKTHGSSVQEAEVKIQIIQGIRSFRKASNSVYID